VFEVQRGEDTADVIQLRAGHPVTWSQSNLNRRRYAQNDETLYIAPEDDRTDYSQPPMANWYGGVLNTGKRRYGHPALNGVLPFPWLPQARANDSQASQVRRRGATQVPSSAVVVTLRKRHSIMRGHSQSQTTAADTAIGAQPEAGLAVNGPTENPWQNSQPRHSHTSTTQLQHRLSYDHGSGVIVLPDSDHWMLEDDSESDVDDLGTQHPEGQQIGEAELHRRHSIYYHHPDRHRLVESQS